MQIRILKCILALVFLQCAAGSAYAQPVSPTSRYTSTAKKDAKVLQEFSDEGGFSFEYLSPGFGGYEVLFCGSGDHSWIKLH